MRKYEREKAVGNVQARQALAASLKCWIANSSWTPELMPTIFAAGASTTGDPPLINAQVTNTPSLTAGMLPTFDRQVLTVKRCQGVS